MLRKICHQQSLITSGKSRKQASSTKFTWVLHARAVQSYTCSSGPDLGLSILGRYLQTGHKYMQAKMEVFN